MNGFINRIVEIASIIALFFFVHILMGLIVNVLIFTVLIAKEIKKGYVTFDLLAFWLTYLSMLITKLLFPAIDVLPHMPHFIYTILAVLAFISLVIKKPFTYGISLHSSHPAPVTEFFRSGIWFLCFVGAAFGSFYFFPNHLYLLVSFSFVIIAIFINILFSVHYRRAR
jgi:hypothetical protein